MADFHITESGDGSIGVMYGSMWIAIPREAHAALFKFCAASASQSPATRRTRVELRQRPPDPPVDLHLIEQDTSSLSIGRRSRLDYLAQRPASIL
jgi:hypothetical protein